MAEDRHERHKPQGDPLREVIEENRAQQQSDAPRDTSVEQGRGRVLENTDRDEGRGSTANGIPRFDEDSGKQRRKQYEDGAELVSGMD